MSGADWRTDELEQERDALQSRVRAWDAEIERLGRLLRVAESAFGDHCERLREIRETQATIRQQVTQRGLASDPDGRPSAGPTVSEAGFYQGLEDARATEERRYATWVDERRQPTANGPISSSWSSRCVSDVQASLAAARRSRALTGAQLERVTDELAHLEAAARQPETPASETRTLVERLRQRLG